MRYTSDVPAVKLSDDLNRQLIFGAPPQRIVPIFASNTEIIASLGLSGRIVGIEAYTRYPPEVLDRPIENRSHRFGHRLVFGKR